MNLFKGLIICKICGKKYNFKNDHGQHIYLCAGYKNYGSKYCQRNVIYENDLVRIVSMHFEIGDKIQILTQDTIKEKITKIEAGTDNIIICYKDGSVSEWNKSLLSV